VPGPLVWTQLAAGIVAGSDGGTRALTGIEADLDTRTPTLVEHADAADGLLVVRADGVSLVGPDAWGAVEPLPPLDPLTPVSRVANIVGGVLVGDADRARSMCTEGAVLTAALLVGIADRALELARTYSLERHQFGRPIGSFQALQHMMADMYVRMMLARSAAYAAAALLDDPGAGDVDLAVASAKVVAGDAAMANARACVQIHGGMGFTWEMMPHYLLKRTWVLENSFRTGQQHTEQIATTLGGKR
jgi:Acyl-CoA dehydrogenase, C-terminal domain